jgi:arylsulfatase
MAAQWENWARRVHVIYEGGQTEKTTDAPWIAQRPLTISGHVDSHQGRGVIVAQGGREHGYAVHLLDGKLAFDVRVQGKVTRIVSDQRAPKTFDFQAELTADSMTLSVQGQQIAQGISPGLIPVQPKDGMNIGRDELTAAGDYTPPNRLDGTVRDLKVIPGKPEAKEVEPTIPSGRGRFGSITKPLLADPGSSRSRLLRSGSRLERRERTVLRGLPYGTQPSLSHPTGRATDPV